LEWDAAHRVLRHESKCANLHGHRYKAEITCAAKLDPLGRVVDFGRVKEIVGTWIDDNWDHTTLANEEDAVLISFVEDQGLGRNVYTFEGEPTAENIALALLQISQSLLDAAGVRVRVERVRVHETPNCWADAHA
jgi:6-pyruvoyltetrahydropterin/6-carboxytetrahydropterin synthase